MNIKALFFDFDNTLLNSRGEISDHTLNVLHKCRQRGIKIAFATGRPKRAVKDLLPLFPWDGGVTSSGASVNAPNMEEITRQIDKPSLLQLKKDIEGLNLDVSFSVEAADSLYTLKSTIFDWAWESKIVDSFQDIPGNGADKLILSLKGKKYIIDEANQDKTHDICTKIAPLLSPQMRLEPDRWGLIAILHKEAEKIYGVRALMNHWGIPLLYAAAFGDDSNDINMLGGVGYGVAVENAIPQLKAAADFICPHCDSDGAAHWIEEHVL